MSIAGIAWRTLAATVVMTVLLSVASGVGTAFVSVPDAGASDAEMLAAVFGSCFAVTAVLVYALLRSTAHGWRLATVLAFVHFGVGAFMSQNETLYFNAALEVPRGVVVSYLAASLFTAALFAPFAVWLFGRWPAREEPEPLGVTRSGLPWKTAVVAAGIYPALYFLFGYFVLWQLPEARMLYQGSEAIVPFGEHVAGVLRDDPWLIPWQMLRGLFWVGLAVVVMRVSRVGWLETGVIVGLLFAFLMNSQHLIPNPYIPGPVRLAHFVETAVSNALLGFSTVWVLRP